MTTESKCDMITRGGGGGGKQGGGGVIFFLFIKKQNFFYWILPCRRSFPVAELMASDTSGANILFHGPPPRQLFLHLLLRVSPCAPWATFHFVGHFKSSAIPQRL